MQIPPPPKIRSPRQTLGCGTSQVTPPDERVVIHPIGQVTAHVGLALSMQAAHHTAGAGERPVTLGTRGAGGQSLSGHSHCHTAQMQSSPHLMESWLEREYFYTGRRANLSTHDRSPGQTCALIKRQSGEGIVARVQLAFFHPSGPSFHVLSRAPAAVLLIVV